MLLHFATSPYDSISYHLPCTVNTIHVTLSWMMKNGTSLIYSKAIKVISYLGISLSIYHVSAYYFSVFVEYFGSIFIVYGICLICGSVFAFFVGSVFLLNFIFSSVLRTLFLYLHCICGSVFVMFLWAVYFIYQCAAYSVFVLYSWAEYMYCISSAVYSYCIC